MKTFMVVVVAVAVLGCDDDGGGGGGGANSALCTSFTPCGGDLIGTWNGGPVCYQVGTSIDACPSATASIDADQSGTVVFNSDNTYATDLMTTYTSVLTIPASCLEDNGISDCAQLSEIIETTCTGSSSCTCTETDSEEEMSTGTFAVSGNSLTLDGADAIEYCVNGDTLSFRIADGEETIVLSFTR